MAGERGEGGERDDGGRERLAMLGQIAAEIAHELRNVLQVISASAFVARQEAARGDAPAALPHIAKIERNARAAHAIVDDLMALARGEPLRAEPVLLAEVVVAARADLPEGCAAWQDVLEPIDLRVRAHPGLLVRLLGILYDNAVKASGPRPPRIATRARVSGSAVVIEVSDDGPGVAPHIAAQVFDPLVTARAGGTGLGLSLARRIATAHGGTIELVEAPAAPAGEGPGATFRVALPLS
ncbi:MAG TPA: HAMP domain-containing sensor histidine kinase [Polyangiaceae bacterium]|nr:HAMP domain-containing sensor histidine kinase [Polyangiaceae bacterium]